MTRKLANGRLHLLAQCVLRRTIVELSDIIASVTVQRGNLTNQHAIYSACKINRGNQPPGQPADSHILMLNTMIRSKLAYMLPFWLLAACSSNPHYDPAKPHHTPSGFRNIYYEDDKGFWALMKWRWEQMFKDIPDADDYQFDVDRSLHDQVRTNTDRPALTWIGHATFLLQFDGMNILTDPQFSDRASPVSWAGPKRVVAPAMSIDDLPDIDVALISHDHYDSLDRQTVTALAAHNRERRLTFIVPLGMKVWIDGLELDSIDVVELDWAQSHAIDGVTFTAEPSQHWCKRTLFDANERLWASWVIESATGRIFFAGDTGYAEHFREIGDRYGRFDLALLPIGAYEPRWFMKGHHVNPEEAVMIHRDIGSRYSVAMHWGTFILTDEPLDEPPIKLAEALQQYDIPNAEFEVYRHGETRFLDELFQNPGQIVQTPRHAKSSR
jgi:L-ascorbate metabolism protein UlaG (beta-lactamase superfamily)